MNHEKLASYRELMQVAEGVAKGMTKWPRGQGYLIDQIRRAMASAVLLVAEGNGKRSSHAERRRFFEMAMGSISEVAAGLDLALAFGLISKTVCDGYKSRLKLAYVKIEALP